MYQDRMNAVETALNIGDASAEMVKMLYDFGATAVVVAAAVLLAA